MSLSLYKKKRDFSETPEPSGKEKSSAKALRFVVQKHDASSLHYDFRLEIKGVLKSWAVPKGPSLNTADKRLAMQVEDHPYDYRTFEGIIPEGNYGAGTVIVWDEGTYTPLESKGLSREEQEQMLEDQWEQGRMQFVLKGKKLKGAFTLFRLKKGGDKSWLLVKKDDAFASDEDITEQNTSVLSGKSIADVAAENGVQPNHPDKEVAKKKTKTAAAKKKAPTKTALKKASRKSKIKIEELLGDKIDLTHQSAMPRNVKPMMARLTDDAFNGGDWLFEIKWDGYRAVAYLQNEKVEIISRNNKPFTDKYHKVTAALQSLNINAVFDGEIVAINEKDKVDFQLLQNWKSNPDLHLQYFVFDVLWVEGYDVTVLPLIERKMLLQKLLPANDEVLRYSDHVEGKGKNFFNKALKDGLEGIMAKRSDSIYEVGIRTDNWLKIKVAQRQEVIICGFTQPRNTRKYLGALLLGVYEENELIYIGHTGSGFNSKSLEQIYKKLQPLITDKCPFKKCPKGNMPVTWVKPKLVCEIKFTEWTNELIARHPIFMGLREDKSPKDVTIENSITMAAVVNKKPAAKNSKTPIKASSKKAKQKSLQKVAGRKGSGLQLDSKEGKDQTIVIDKHELQLTNLDKLYWKKEGGTKGDVINHYLRMAPYILPYMLRRPQSLHRHTNGIDAPGFYQKDVQGKIPQWMQTHVDFSESTNEEVHYLVCSNEATLIYMANLGCIEMNPWHSRVETVENPDWCLIDLDPDNNTFDEVMETALVVKKVMDAAGIKGVCKTSGSTGIHIYIPLAAKYNYDDSKQLAETLVKVVNKELPQSTSLERAPAKRKGKIYLDFLQNKQTQTAAAPYSLRPKPGMPVSTPMHWDELKKGLTITTYNINNIFERVKAEGDLFKPVLGRAINLKKAVEILVGLIK